MPKLEYAGIGDILKGEALPLSRVAVPAEKGTKAGTLVKYPLRKLYLVALTDEQEGKVLVQPHNCVVNLDHTSDAALKKLKAGADDSTPLTVDLLRKEGDNYGIVYIGAPYK